MPAPSAWTHHNISILLWVQGFEGMPVHLNNQPQSHK